MPVNPRRREKSKAHQQRLSAQFDWAAEAGELERNEFGDVITPPPPDDVRAAWLQTMRDACTRAVAAGTHIARACGTGARSKYLGSDQAGRAVWKYQLVTYTIGAGAAAMEGLYPVDPTSAVLLGKKASGYVLDDMRREIGCSLPWLIGFIHGFDGIKTLPVKADLLDHPDFLAGRDDGRLLAAEYIRTFIA